MKLRVVTLNCWGVHPIMTRRLDERFGYLGKALLEADYDIVALQEVFLEKNYNMIKAAVADVLPYSHYFYSGILGSGLCIFSRFPIVRTFFHPYTLNGYPYEIRDWLGYKGVGFCRIEVHGSTLNVYVTHLHAEYSRENDVHLPHRVTQAVQLSQLVSSTAGNDPAIIMGDLNFEPVDIGYRFVKTTLNFKDAWLEGGDKTPGCTCELRTNSFHTINDYPKRIDYILYNDNRMKCEVCKLTFSKIPNETYNYSDHEGVEATFRVLRTKALPNEITEGETREVLKEAHAMISDSIISAKVKHVVHYYIVAMMLVLAILMGWTIYSNFFFEWEAMKVLMVIAFPVTFALAITAFFLALLFDNAELRGLRCYKNDLEVWIQNTD